MGLSRLFGQEEKEYGTLSTQRRGEKVKSRAEKQIADYFTNSGIRYVYEWKAQTNAIIFTRTFASVFRNCQVRTRANCQGTGLTVFIFDTSAKRV